MNDKNDEADGDVTVKVTGGGVTDSYKLGDTVTATIRVNDNDESGANDRIQMKNVKKSVAEFGNDKGDARGIRILVSIGNGLSPKGHARTINYTVGGTATRGDGKDYTIDGCTSSTCDVKLPANRHTAVITIYVNNDGLDENDETIVFTLKDGAGYTLGPENTRKTTVTIRDDDTRGLTFHRTWPDVDEGGSETHTLKLASQPTAAVTVKIVSNNPDVTIGEGKNPASTSNSISLTFNPSGETKLWSRTQTVTVSAAQDSDAVDDEATLRYTTSGGDYGGANALSIDRPVSVDDDDTRTTTGPQLPRISLTGGAAVTEGSPASFTVNADPAPAASLTVNVEVIEPPGQDFVAANQEGVRTVTLNAGATSASFTVPTVDDNADEDDGFVQVFVNDGTGYNEGSGGIVNVNDNDGSIPAAYFGSSSWSAIEDDGTHDVNVDLTRPAPSGGLTLQYSVSGTATAGIGNDFTIQNSGTLSIAAGGTSATISVAINDDSTTESAETVILTLTGGEGYTIGSPSFHTLTITDNDATSQATLSLSGPASTNEGNSGTSDNYFTVNLSGVPSRFVAWQLCFGGTATSDLTGSGTIAAGADYQPISSQTPINLSGRSPVCTDRRFTPSGSLTNTDVGIRIKGDTDVESDETVVVTLRIDDGPADVVLGTSVATYTIQNDDSSPELVISNSTVNVTEGGTGSYTVKLATAPTGTVTVNIASNNPDVTVIPNPLTFHASGNSKLWSVAQTVTVSAAQDNDANDETATLSHSASGGGYNSVTGSVTVRVDDDEPPPVNASIVSFSSASYSTAEGEAVTIQVNISPTRNSATNLGITYDSGTALSGDYNQSPTSITIPANTSSQTFTVQTTEDNVNETNETFRVSIGNVPSGVNRGNPSAATVTINDDDSGGTITPPATPQVSINNPSVVEGDSGTASLRFVVSLSAGAAGEVTVDYRTSGGTATSGNDYAQVAGGTLTFQSGERQKSITVNVNGDDIDEDDETVVIQLSNLTGGAQFAGSAATIEGTGRIRDDDRAGMRFSPTVVQISDQDETQTYTVSLTSDPIGTATVTVASKNEQVATVSPAQLTFTSSNWDEGLEVTVTATGEKGSSTSIAHEFPDSAGGGYASLNRSLRVYVGENIAQGINAWIGRFGGTVASDIRDAIRKRLKHTDSAESSVTVAGQSIEFGTTKRSDYIPQSNYTFDLNARRDNMDEQTEIRHLSKQEAFGNASFNLNTSGSEATGRSLWGQAVFSEFGGRDGEREFDGKIKSAITGAEIRDQGWTAGAVLSYSKGDGGYTIESGIRGEFESDLTALTPYGAVEVSEGLEAWGALGFGSGKLHTRPDGGGKLSSDLRWRMIAAGASKDLDHLGAPGGFELSAFADAFHARTESSRTQEADHTRADASQFRFGIDGHHEQVFSNGQSLTVLLDAALRQDTGVGDNGSGIDLGGSANFGISENLSAAVEGRVLILHGADDHKEESIGFSMDYDDNRKTLAGASASFGVNIGNPQGADSLQESPSMFANRDESASLTQSWTAEYAYGVDYRRSGLVRSHYVQSRWDNSSRTQALGIRLQPDSRSAPNFSVDAYVSSFQDRTRSQDSEMSSRLEATWRW